MLARESCFREEGIIFKRMRLSMTDKELALEKYKGRIFHTKEEQVRLFYPKEGLAYLRYNWGLNWRGKLGEYIWDF